jgi:phosphatidylserine/phosphatidylglycerophosphate/cardiolipin synthase-like enzyme
MRAVLIVQPTCTLVRTSRLSRVRLPAIACPYSSTASSSKQPAISTSAGHLSSSISSQYRLPRFTVPSSNVSLIEHPSDFYKELLAIISRARRRIFIASLYIGKTETDLVSESEMRIYAVLTLACSYHTYGRLFGKGLNSK